MQKDEFRKVKKEGRKMNSESTPSNFYLQYEKRKN